MQAELKVVGGKQQGTVIPLNRKKFLIGREEDCQLRPNSELVSRHHCVFTLDDYTVRLRDLGSTNGTFVNGKRATTQLVLKDGDEIRIGKLVLQISIWEPVAAPTSLPIPASPDFLAHEPTGQETLSDFAISAEPTKDDEVKTGIYGGDTTLISPKAPVAETAKQPLPVRLPPPEETGVIPKVPVIVAPVAGGAATSPETSRSSAADIIRQYMQKRPQLPG